MSEPPKLAEWLLRRLVGGRDSDAVAGDLRETFAARGASRLWYWGQVLSCLAVRVSLYRRRSIPGIGTDFSRAFRRLRRNPGYALTAMVCLALALGVNATLFSFLDSLYFRRLPVPEADRMVTIRRQGGHFCNWQEYFSIRNDLHTVQAAAVLFFSDSMETGSTGFDASIEGVSSNYAQVLRLGTSLGAWFTPGSEADPEPPAIISYRLWKSRFASDPRVIGKRVRIFLNRTFVITGVARPEFVSSMPPIMVDAWIPLRPVSRVALPDLVARMAPGATPAGVKAEMDVISARLRASDPRNEEIASGVLVEPRAGFASGSRKAFFVPVVTLLAAISGMVLLIACVNVANLLLSRATVRQREMAVRQALGASRLRLFRETIAEGLVLAAGGLLLGLVFGYASGRVLGLLLPSLPIAMYRGLNLGIDWRVALFLAGAGGLCAIFFSLPPALANGRRGLHPAMKGADARNSRQREIYPVVQVALSLTLLVATGLLLRALTRVEHIDPGFATDHRLYVHFSGRSDFDRQATPQLYSHLLEQAREVPGVRDATLAWRVFPRPGYGCASPTRRPQTNHVRANSVDPNYFDLMDIPILRGRGFSSADSNTLEVIVNQTLARTWWPHEDPLGQTVWLCSGLAVVAGVARDAKYESLDEDPEPLYYVPRRQDTASDLSLIVRTEGDPRQWLKPILDVAQREGGTLRIYDSGTLNDAIAESLWEARWQASLLGFVGLLAIVLAAIGVYGVVACSVAQRTREIGVRMALGAAPLDVQWMVLAHALRITAIGIAVGLLLSAATVRLLRGFLYGLSPFDPAAFAGASLAWIAIAIVASWYPARRATRVDPVTALNYE
ncbi:MAG TPA: ADOP family duplicated permease [Bryobacteraceae bacterium]|nr:ADOP family duplicated permease [Bryobacteraceae bacterium]